MDFCLLSEEFPMISCTPVLGSVNFNLTGVSVHCISFWWNVMLSWRRVARHPNYKCQQENFYIYVRHLFVETCTYHKETKTTEQFINHWTGVSRWRRVPETELHRSVTMVTFTASLHILTIQHNYCSRRKCGEKFYKWQLPEHIYI